MEHGHGMLMPFDRDEPLFALGFECGRVYAIVNDLLCDEEGDEETWAEVMPLTVHAENAEMMLRIAERYGVGVASEELNEEWIDVTFSPSPTAAEDGRT